MGGRGPRTSRLALRAAALALLAVVIGGAGSCSGTAATTSSVTATGTTLKVYASAPAGLPVSDDVLAAEKLALPAGTQVGRFRVTLVPERSAKVSDNARSAIEDQSAIAYIGELAPGASAASMGITNALDLLQVSPGDTALALTQSSAAVPGAPGNLYESFKTYGRTFARVVPSGALEARAQVQLMRSVGVRRLYVTDDSSPYGAALALAVKQAAGAMGPVQGLPTAAAFKASGADAVFDAADGADSAAAGRFLAAVASQDPTVKLFVPSAVQPAALTSALAAAGGGKLNLYASAPGFLPGRLPAAAAGFARRFQAAYGHPPPNGALFGYEAVSAVLAALRQAGAAASDRTAVVHDFFAIRNRPSLLGSYSIDSAGDTTLGPFVFTRLRSGSLVPFKFVEVQG